MSLLNTCLARTALQMEKKGVRSDSVETNRKDLSQIFLDREFLQRPKIEGPPKNMEKEGSKT